MEPKVPYEEFGLLHENAEEFGLSLDPAPALRRVETVLDDGRRISAIRWGDAAPELVLLHGGAQNAHTWDTVALALRRPLLAIDLPGHGHSDQAADPDRLSPEDNARDVAVAIARLAPSARAVVGMSLGGLTTIALADHSPALVRRMLLVDVTPGVNGQKSKAITDFVRGPATFASFEELLARTIEHNPGRTVASLRRGILHNAFQLDDGSWMWRYRRFQGSGVVGTGEQRVDWGRLWDALERSTAPVLLARGMRKQSVVDDADVAELLRRRPDAEVVEFPDAGHSIQGDSPVELAATIARFTDTSPDPLNVDIVEEPARRIATVAHHGPYNEIGEAFQRLGAIAGPAGLFGGPDAAMVAIYDDDPAVTPVDELRSDAGLVVDAGRPLPEGLGARVLPAGRYARTTHLGSFDSLGDTWAALLGTWLPASGERLAPSPMFEIYRTDMMTTPPPDWRTDLFIPLA